ncbi:MAG: hypothetical protein FWG70_07130 [Oscillospiraceae bacterium]|nr:hypothetical protein [Oscillospiraceae bacterium]
MINTIHINDIKGIQAAGFNALVESLGAVGAVKFMMQFDTGSGDYTKERHNILKDVTMNDVVNELGLAD